MRCFIFGHYGISRHQGGQKYREIVAGSLAEAVQTEPDFLPPAGLSGGTPSLGTPIPPADHNGDDIESAAIAGALAVQRDRVIVQSELEPYPLPDPILDTGKGVLGLKNGANAVAFVAGDEDGHAVDSVAFTHG